MAISGCLQQGQQAGDALQLEVEMVLQGHCAASASAPPWPAPLQSLVPPATTALALGFVGRGLRKWPAFSRLVAR